MAMKNLHRYDYETQNGERHRVRKDEIYAWVAVQTETGEVDLDDIRQWDDDLEPLAQGWEWRKFNLILANDRDQGHLPSKQDSQSTQRSSG
jgi:DUF1365 family protein